jgi:hypothetical protein
LPTGRILMTALCRLPNNLRNEFEARFPGQDRARARILRSAIANCYMPIIRQLKYKSFLLLAADPRICLLIEASTITVSRMQ